MVMAYGLNPTMRDTPIGDILTVLDGIGIRCAAPAEGPRSNAFLDDPDGKWLICGKSGIARQMSSVLCSPLTCQPKTSNK